MHQLWMSNDQTNGRTAGSTEIGQTWRNRVLSRGDVSGLVSASHLRRERPRWLGEMLQFLKVGIFAGFLQLIIVTLVACLAWVPTLWASIVPATNATTPTAELLYIYALLKWVFLLLAVGVVLTDTKYSSFTAARIRNVSRLMRPDVPDHAANTLLVLLALPTAGFAVLTLRQPPDFVLALSSYFENSGHIWITWSALMSVGVAFSGAISHAAWRAGHSAP